MRVITAAVVYFAAVFGVGFMLGPIRVLWLEPTLGKTLAVLCEVPLLLMAMVWAAWLVPKRLYLAPSFTSLAAMGIGALLLQQLADFAVGFGMRGMGPAEQLQQFATPAGLIYGVSLLAFAVMPLLINRRTREHPGSTLTNRSAS